MNIQQILVYSVFTMAGVAGGFIIYQISAQ